MILRRLAVAPIRAYQRLFSPALGQRCRYYPSCSTYAVQAVKNYGILRGLVLAVWRVLRCNPLSRGGVDPVHEQRLFKTRGRPASV
ncbi:MAG: membrane protein insertion efficiency factor YidD [Solirubrobacteraceae bacterium]